MTNQRMWTAVGGPPSPVPTRLTSPHGSGYGGYGDGGPSNPPRWENIRDKIFAFFRGERCEVMVLVTT